MIHPSAIIDASAKIAGDVEIGPWVYIGPQVEIDSGTVIAPHVVVKGPTKIGKNNRIFQFASIGEDPQDKKFQPGSGEQSELIIGDGNVFREYVTINRGTEQGGGKTTIGNENLFMAYVHVAHDCIVKNHCNFANYAALAGHVVVEDYVGIGGFTGVHQFCRIGTHSFIGLSSVISKDVLPYVLVSGSEAKTFGLNLVGLKRRGFPPETVTALKSAYKFIYRKGFTVSMAIDEIKTKIEQHQEIKNMIEFLESSERGVIR